MLKKLNDTGAADQKWCALWWFKPNSVRQSELPSLDPLAPACPAVQKQATLQEDKWIHFSGKKIPSCIHLCGKQKPVLDLAKMQDITTQGEVRLEEEPGRASNSSPLSNWCKVILLPVVHQG